MTEPKSEVVILAEAIHTCADAVEIAGMGKLTYKMDGDKIGIDPTNIIINSAALTIFSILLQSKVADMYVKSQEAVKSQQT